MHPECRRKPLVDQLRAPIQPRGKHCIHAADSKKQDPDGGIPESDVNCPSDRGPNDFDKRHAGLMHSIRWSVSKRVVTSTNGRPQRWQLFECVICRFLEFQQRALPLPPGSCPDRKFRRRKLDPHHRSGRQALARYAANHLAANPCASRFHLWRALSPRNAQREQIPF